ncbi:MAG: polysaccharide deacetylase family protein [Candidatus Omnitrophica bacterium]|nr:polysaccharide deacetylase family protein [Candidatus Omnitrophota bacterium]
MGPGIKTPIILMYHGIVAGQVSALKGRDVGADIYDVKKEDFVRHMSVLDEGRYEATKGFACCEKGAKKVIITFDDGEINNFTEAYPVLKEFGFPAYFFVIARRIGQKGYMGWEELKALREGGMVVGSHGLSHEILTNLQDTQIKEELAASKRYIEKNLGIVVDALSIPRGFCNDKILRMAKAIGYKHVFISERPMSVRLPCWSRVVVKGNWSIERFKQAVRGEVPMRERVNEIVKNSLKFVLRERGYNTVRSLVIKILK